jgi:precorrin-4/cobalt-precorrin-4 C11-methyltransferase
MMIEKHAIVFCGAGPGTPDLITVRGQQALARADLVLYAGSLVPRAVLAWARPDARCINSAQMDLEGIVEVMAEAYDQGRQVVRLHSGDPSLYGAVHEQMVQLRARGIAFTVIPGVTAAFAAAAAMGMEYTLPETTQTLIVTRLAGRTPVPETETLAALAAHKASMAVYLSMAQIDKVAAVLAEAYGATATCAVAYKVSHPEEKIFTVPIADLAESVKKAGIDRHALVLVGPAVDVNADAETLRSKLYDGAFPR